MQVAQDRPVFDTLAACQSVCYAIGGNPSNPSLGCYCEADTRASCTGVRLVRAREHLFLIPKNTFPVVPGDSGIGKDCKGLGLHPSACHEASLVEGMEEELGNVSRERYFLPSFNLVPGHSV